MGGWVGVCVCRVFEILKCSIFVFDPEAVLVPKPASLKTHL